MLRAGRVEKVQMKQRASITSLEDVARLQRQSDELEKVRRRKGEWVRAANLDILHSLARSSPPSLSEIGTPCTRIFAPKFIHSLFAGENIYLEKS